MKLSIITEQDKPAGSFSSWLKETILVIRDKGESEVACAECSACCKSSYFIHITPADTDAIKHIPKELTFAAPGLPKGHLLLGYDEKGRCPMFIDKRCSIYDYRPQTCRQYDCRVFPATGIEIDEPGKELIARQTRRWKFEFSTEQDRRAFKAVQSAAKFLSEHAADFPDDFLPKNTTQRAILAITVYKVFLNTHAEKDIEADQTIKLIVASCRKNALK